MNKKVVSIILVMSVLSILMINFISAMTLFEGITAVANSVIQILEPIFSFLLGNVGGGLLFVKILLFIIIFGIVWISLGKIDFFSEHKPILHIITFAVSVLAIRGISSSDLINTILLPYTALGVALSAGIPFVIYFVVVNVGLGDQPSIVRRIAWIFFAVIFVGLSFSRTNTLGNFQYIYLATAGIALIMAFIDGSIKGLFAKIEADKLKNINKLEISAKLNTKLKNYKRMVQQGTLKSRDYKILKKNLQRQARLYGIKKFI